MRILLIAPPWFTVPPTNYGGIEWVVSLLADGLVDAGHDVTLLASQGSQTGARLVTVFGQPPSREIGNPWYETRHVLAGYRMRDQFDVIHDHTGSVGPSMAALLDGPPVVHTLHGPWTPESAALHRDLAGEIALVAISGDQARRTPKGIPITAVVPNGIPVDRYPFRGESRRGENYLAFIGRANREKGPEVAIEVARRTGRPLKMLVKISEPQEQAYWREVVEPLLPTADVDVLSELSLMRKGELLAHADALIFPIQWPEPFGLVMAEAMACGTPVIGYDNGAASEVVEDGVTGFLAPPGDVNGLVERIEGCPQIDPAACRDRVEQLFSGRSMVRGYLEVYEKVRTEQLTRAR